jgi:hypothetical protein
MHRRRYEHTSIKFTMPEMFVCVSYRSIINTIRSILIRYPVDLSSNQEIVLNTIYVCANTQTEIIHNLRIQNWQNLTL